MDKRQRIISILCLPGIFVSGYLTYVHYSGEPIYCGGSNSCELVNSSRFAFIGPIPVSALGLAGYILILILSLVKSDEERPWPAILIFGLSLIGVMFQLYLSYIEAFVLYEICYWCVSSQIIILIIFLLALPRRMPATSS
jgi:vitamin-K-epoxide reductase (warfarin-sensitive)